MGHTASQALQNFMWVKDHDSAYVIVLWTDMVEYAILPQRRVGRGWGDKFQITASQRSKVAGRVNLLFSGLAGLCKPEILPHPLGFYTQQHDFALLGGQETFV